MTLTTLLLVAASPSADVFESHVSADAGLVTRVRSQVTRLLKWIFWPVRTDYANDPRVVHAFEVARFVTRGRKYGLEKKIGFFGVFFAVQCIACAA